MQLISTYTTYRKPLVWFAKLVLIMSVGYLVYDQVLTNKDTDLLLSRFVEGMDKAQIWFLILCVALMPVNWVLESVKWRTLVLPFTQISVIDAIKGVFAGISVGIITPARLGEYGGRLLVVPDKDKVKSIPATLVSSVAQNISNIIGGYIGAMIFCLCYFSVNRFVYIASSMLGLLAIVIICTLYYNVSKLNLDWLNRWKWGALLSKQAHVLSLYDKPILHRVLLLSGLRYLIYCTQYVLILYFLGVELSILAAFSGVAVIYLLQSGIPLPPILSVIARGELAVIIWSIFTDNVAAILVATFGLWLINLVIPAIMGLLIVLNVNLYKSTDL